MFFHSKIAGRIPNIPSNKDCCGESFFSSMVCCHGLQKSLYNKDWVIGNIWKYSFQRFLKKNKTLGNHRVTSHLKLLKPPKQNQKLNQVGQQCVNVKRPQPKNKKTTQTKTPSLVRLLTCFAGFLRPWATEFFPQNSFQKEMTTLGISDLLIGYTVLMS